MRRATLVFLLTLATSVAESRLVRLNIEIRETVLDGKAFGLAGAYEKLSGTVELALDLDLAANAIIVDLELAPRNENGEVELSSDFFLLKPVDPKRSNDVLFYEAGNRGTKRILATFQKATRNPDPTRAEDFGNGSLMSQGFSFLWMGWQWDVPAGRMRMKMPVATHNGAPMRSCSLAFAVFLVSGLTFAQERGSVSRADFIAFEQELSGELPTARSQIVPEADGTYRAEAFEVELPDGRAIPVFVQPPPGFNASQRWPLMLAMHGGPTRDQTSALRGALRMLSVWLEPAAEAGWLIVSPAMTHVVARGPRTVDRLPYEILRADQIDAILQQVARRYPVDPNRIVSTGISLGSNFSIAFAAARPDRLAAIVPVSTEGESREHLLRNLMHVPTFVLEGALDPNIRAVQGPRALDAILNAFEYDHVYRELPDRSHEGFEEHYPEVLRWLAERPRRNYPLEVVRVPHRGIMPLARRVHWIESDTRRGLVRARVVSRHRIDVEARWARSLRVYVHDRLVDLDAPFEIRVNGESVHRGMVERSIDFARNDVRATGDLGHTYAGVVEVDVPTSAESLKVARRLSASLRVRHPEGVLSFWETYAMRSLEDRLPPLGLVGRETEAANREQMSIRIDDVAEDSAFFRAGLRRGDVLVEVDGEPFFEGSGLDGLRSWLVRELEETPREVSLRIRRGGKEQMLLATLSLEPF